MTIWRYIGCEIDKVPKEILSEDCLSPQQIRELLDTMPLVEGHIEAVTVDSLTALLLNDNIFPIKIHPQDGDESQMDRLKRLQSLARQQIKRDKKNR